MGLDDFEKALRLREDTEPYFSRAQTQGPAFRFALWIASQLGGLAQDEWAFVGRNAVDAYLVKYFGPKIFGLCRNAGDVDMATRGPEALGILLSSDLWEKQFHSSRRDPTNKDSMTIADIVGDDARELTCEVDYWRSNNKDSIDIHNYHGGPAFFAGFNSIDVFGVAVNVPDLIDLIDIRLRRATKAEEIRPTDRVDLCDLVSCYVAEKITSGRIYCNAEGSAMIGLEGEAKELSRMLGDASETLKTEIFPKCNIVTIAKYGESGADLKIMDKGQKPIDFLEATRQFMAVYQSLQ
ncbi:MAG: hypothetical protein ABIG95_01920 [Candidatus Woesearchaeota archaeon]